MDKQELKKELESLYTWLNSIDPIDDETIRDCLLLIEETEKELASLNGG